VTIGVVPVLDVRAGKAVRADGGARAAYEPLRSAWTAGRGGRGAGGAGTADPVDVARSLRDGLGVRILYLAHLDAIEEAAGALRGPNGAGEAAGSGPRSSGSRAGAARPALADACALVRTLAGLGIDAWVDAGTGDAAAAAEALGSGAARVVVGLETLAGAAELEAIAALDPGERAGTPRGGPAPMERGAGGDERRARLVFGLDVRSAAVVASAPELRRLSPLAAAARAAAAGFGTILLLDLDRVGRVQGPPLDLVCRLRDAVPGVEWAAGGGVRGEADVAALEEAGCAWCLAGTALHAGALRPRPDQAGPAAASGPRPDQAGPAAASGPRPSVSLHTAD
jgi:phosphoribosylformimino-5-aminoimidazole carboxamide ribotide isomerase